MTAEGVDIDLYADDIEQDFNAVSHPHHHYHSFPVFIPLIRLCPINNNKCKSNVL